MAGKPTYDELEQAVHNLKRSEEVLQDNEMRFQLLFERAPIAYQSLDEDGNFIEVNPPWLDILGYTREEVIGKSFSEFLHPDWKYHFMENFSRFKAIGEVLGVEFEMVKKDGSLILVSFHGKIGKDKNGNFKQTHCVFQDITEPKQAQMGREKLLKTLHEAIENIKTLHGLLPICASCKKIRDDKGYWNQIERYIENYSYAKFSHGMCPDCSDDLYGKEDWYIEMKK
ncbi:MAG: PAS domain S-box protein [Desulfobacula sp.]|nr:PAS domain S-box protein [Desulfobacula sp.]